MRISLILLLIVILYFHTAQAFIGALISGAVAVAKTAAKFAIKAATDAAKAAIKDAIRKRRETEKAKKRDQDLNKKRKQIDGGLKSGGKREMHNKVIMPDEPSDIDDLDIELMEGIVAYKAKHPTTPFLDGADSYTKINKISQKDVRRVLINQ